MKGILETLEHQLESRQTRAEVKELPVVQSDRTVLEQVFGNLLDNATKYLAPERPGLLRIEASCAEGEVQVCVHDNGHGIAQGDMEKVFAPFRRTGKLDTQGKGMGWAYVRSLVRALGGRSTCTSDLGVGTTFTVVLPRRFPQCAEKSSPS